MRDSTKSLASYCLPDYLTIFTVPYCIMLFFAKSVNTVFHLKSKYFLLLYVIFRDRILFFSHTDNGCHFPSLPQLGQLVNKFLGLVPAKARIGDGLSIAMLFDLLVAVL